MTRSGTVAVVDSVPATAGRPRDADLDERITTAALSVLRFRGPEGVTVEAVADQAQCGKTSIYRRYRNSNAILTAALARLAHSLPPANTDLSPRQQLVDALEQFRSGIEDEIGLRGVAALLYDPDSEFALIMRQQLLSPRVQVVLDLVRRAALGGELPETIDAQAVVHCLAGSYFAELALTGHVSRSWAHHTVNQLPSGQQ